MAIRDDSTDKNPPLSDVSESEISALVDDVLRSGKHLTTPAEQPSLQPDTGEQPHVKVIASQMQRLAQHVFGGEPSPEAPEEDKDEWWFDAGGRRLGPLSLRKIRYLWEEGELTPDSLCWRQGFTTWVSLFRISELARALSPKRVEPERLLAVAESLRAEPPPTSSSAGWQPSAGRQLEQAARRKLEPEPPPPPPPEPLPLSAPLRPEEQTAGVFALTAPSPSLPRSEPELEAPRPKRGFNLANALVSGLVSGLVLAAAIFAMRYFSPPAAAPAAAPPPVVAAPAPVPAPQPPAPAPAAAAPSPVAAPAPVAAAPVLPALPRPPTIAVPKPAPAPQPGEAVAAPAPKPAPARNKPATVEEAFAKEFTEPGHEPTELSTAQIMQAVVKHKAAVDACVEQQHKAAPEESGRLVMRWTVHTDGHVTGVEVKDPEQADLPLASCLAKQIPQWRFPEHDVAGDPVELPFPY